MYVPMMNPIIPPRRIGPELRFLLYWERINPQTKGAQYMGMNRRTIKIDNGIKAIMMTQMVVMATTVRATLFTWSSVAALLK
jgi:hypothetical protein